MLAQRLKLLVANGGGGAGDLVGKVDGRLVFFIE